MGSGIRAGAIASILASVWACSGPSPARAQEAYADARTKALAPTRQVFDRIKAAHPQDPGIERLRERLAAVDRIVDLVCRRLEFIRAASMEKLIGDVPGRSAGPSTQPAGAMRALDVLEESAEDFAAALPPPEVTPAERDLLVRHYDAAVSAASSFVNGRAEAIARLDEKSAIEAVQLALVIPLLTHPDERWDEQAVAALPAWVRTPARLPVAETFALAADRPRAAYAIAMFDRQLTAPRNRSLAAPPSPAEYFRATAARLAAQRNHAGAIRCLHAAIESAGADKKSHPILPELREQLAAAYEQSGHPDLAAEEMKRQLAVPSLPAETYARAATLRLKYLYTAGRFHDLLREAPAYQADERCKPQIPQVLYIEWVTLRRLGRGEGAKRVQATFLERFPDHLLGADMYFADAMTALAASDYDQALRQFDTIEARYARSRLIPRVKEIRARLENSKTSGSP